MSLVLGMRGFVTRSMIGLCLIAAALLAGSMPTTAGSPTTTTQHVYDMDANSAHLIQRKGTDERAADPSNSRPGAGAAAKPDLISASAIAAKTAAVGGSRTAGQIVAEGAEAVGVHGNSRASTALTHLYRLEDAEGNLLKWGVTNNLKGRYSQGFLSDKTLIPMTSGSRSNMLNLERWIVERDPGPLNLERWAGSMQ